MGRRRRQDLSPYEPFSTGLWRNPTGDEIRSVIEDDLEIPQTQVATLLGVDGRTVRRWLSGEREMSYATWVLLLFYANYEVDRFGEVKNLAS